MCKKENMSYVIPEMEVHSFKKMNDVLTASGPGLSVENTEPTDPELDMSDNMF